MTAVSVIIPTYNRATLLRRAVESVLAQSFRDLEVIVVDDGSTDDTEAVILSIPASERIRYIRQPNLGAPTARNRGVSEARGEWIAFQDSDDEWHPRFLSTTMPHARANRVVFTSHSLVRRSGAREIVPHSLVGDPTRALLRGNFVSTQATVMSRSLIAEKPFDESLARFQDWDLWLTFVESGIEFVHIPDTLVTLYRQDDSISEGSASRRRESLRRILAKHGRTLRRDPYAALRLAARAYAPQRVVRAAQDRRESPSS